MRRTGAARASAVALAVATTALGCGGAGGGGAGDGGDHDCHEACDAGTDSAAAEYRWQLTARDATRLYGFEDQSPLAEGRSTRVAVEHGGLACDLWAMPQVDVTAATHTVLITPRVFVRAPACTLSGGATRVVTLALTAGTWTVRATGLAAPLTITVAAAPTRACGLAPCTLDCDCDTAAGERCLGAMGLGGAFTQCARPCEHDRDCAGSTGSAACVDYADGPFRVCEAQAECTAAFPCPAGFDCDTDAACAPTFSLSQTSRAECGRDGDCLLGLRCVVGTAPGARTRCEATCRTGGAWCQGLHTCGPASADLSGLAAADSVCGFLGE